ncbi:MAG: OmpW family outer membrane protein [Flavobacterium sp.]|jgi:outer membrane protein|uniref:OmpW/AlkL family protein n=1 Tax=Flavobacterium sp. TaxID=239 RepID=UPI0029713ADA|nr:OmpW family outer membrane protein [Flavobacterium sp.]TAF08131.1 MAG: OmpW family protein [Flavobacteriia bacterium]WRH74017.1 MAG: OmpW family outer membrane protein [Flavobacterium sp.]
MRKIVFALMAMSLMTVNFVNAQDNETKEESKSNEFKRWQVRLRAVGVAPDESASIGIIGGDVAISNALIPELDFTYFFTENFAAELILGTAKHDVQAINTAAGDVNLGSVWLLPPTLTAQYHFYTSDKKVFKPYIGAGVNYTLFYNVKSGDVADVSYDNALGYAAQLGFDLMLDETFFINLDVKRLFLSTDVSVDASNLAPGLIIPAEVDVNPWLVGVGVGMKF